MCVVFFQSIFVSDAFHQFFGFEIFECHLNIWFLLNVRCCFGGECVVLVLEEDLKYLQTYVLGVEMSWPG